MEKIRSLGKGVSLSFILFFFAVVSSFTRAGEHTGIERVTRGASEAPPVNQAYLDQCASQDLSSKPATEKAPDEKRSGLIKLYKEAQSILSSPRHQCTECHKPGSTQGSKNFIDILDRSELVAKNILNIEKPELSSLHQQLKTDAMPIDGEPLSAEEKSKVLEWIKAGAPDERGNLVDELPLGFVSENDKNLCILKDLRTVPKEEQATTRYFSLAHLYNAGRETESARVAVNRLLNSLTTVEKLTLPRKVDQAGTLLRINLKDYGWTASQWDEILKKNPYGIEVSSNTGKDVYSKTGVKIPEVRADWFVFAASKEPLYSELLQLPGRDGQTPGADGEFVRKFGGTIESASNKKELFSVGNRQSGVSSNNRAFQRIPTANGYVYKSDDFKTSEGKQNIFEHPLDYEKNGGEYIASIPKMDEKGNRMVAQVYGLFNEKTLAVPDVDTNLGIVAHPARYHDAFRIGNGVSCFDCHETLGSGIINPKKNNLSDHARNNSNLFASKDLEKLLENYKPQEELEAIYEKDQAAYGKFMEATGGKPGIVFKVANGFNDTLSERQVAAELGVPLSVLREDIKKSPELKRRLAFDSTGFISRKAFLNEFKPSVALLNFGIDLAAEEAKKKQEEEQQRAIREQLKRDRLVQERLKEQREAQRILKEVQQRRLAREREKAETERLARTLEEKIKKLESKSAKRPAEYFLTDLMKSWSVWKTSKRGLVSDRQIALKAPQNLVNGI